MVTPGEPAQPPTDNSRTIAPTSDEPRVATLDIHRKLGPLIRSIDDGPNRTPPPRLTRRPGAPILRPMSTEPPALDPVLRLSAAEIARAVNGGELRAGDVVAAALDRIDAGFATNAFITVCADEAIARAREIDRLPVGARGPLAGVPLAVKDLFDTAGTRTTAGSRILAGNVPRRTAPSVAGLEAAGAIVLGKTNMHEFAWGVTSQNPHYGTVANPVLPGRVAGGSSGGNAAALADHQVAVALGTDTGGSIRIPSACCGTVGFKPAHASTRRPGTVSARGVFPLSPSFDTVGPMARTVADVALVESVLTGLPIPDSAVDGLRVGVLELTGIEAALRSLGARLEAAELPEPHPDVGSVFTAECAVTHLRWYPARRDDYGPDLQMKLDAAQRMTAVQWRRGVAAIPDFRRAVGRLPFDLFVGPVMAIEPPPADCWEPDVRQAMTRLTRPFNFLGWPAIAIGGVQLAGRRREVVLGAALALERAGVVARAGGGSVG
jgi:aspartyl-tRNA(Asn)/glutamyl-tRNA(Gln) amidotransferase subunit A